MNDLSDIIRLMLAKSWRIKGRITKDFFATAACWGWTWGRMFFRVDETIGVKIAIITPKRYFALSVARHQAKRKVASVLEKMKIWELLVSGEYVIVLNERLETMTRERLESDILYFITHKLKLKNEVKCGKIGEIETKEMTL